MLMRLLEAGVVVELGVARPPLHAPMRGETLQYCRGRSLGEGPRHGRPAVQGHAREDVDQGAVGQLEQVHKVEELAFGGSLPDGRQMPAGGRWGSQMPLAVIGNLAGEEDASCRSQATKVPAS